jgi:hypothetical protein
MIMYPIIEMCITGREKVFEEGALPYFLYIYQMPSFNDNPLDGQLSVFTGI